MADVPQVTIVDGIPTGGTGTVETLSTTNAKLDTIAGHVDTLETLIASTNTKLDTAITALQIIDNMVLAAGTNNIGDVDVLTVITGTGATNLGKAEDAAHASGDTGVAILGVRRDTPISDCANGDYATLNVDATGHLYVKIAESQLDGSEYETVAASQTAQTLGATGGTGDFISKVLVVPATTSPGNVLLLDNATSITVFAGGTGSVSNLVPFVIDLGMTSVSGAWKITTGANVSCIGIGNFT